MNTTMARITFGTFLLAALLLLNGCAARSINQVLANPSEYSNKDVKLEGQVTESYSVLGNGAYQLDDGTGQLWVVSTRGVPRKGARISVKGKIRDGFNLGPLIQLPRQLESGLVLVESSHRAKD